jgi:hypothetical protein
MEPARQIPHDRDIREQDGGADRARMAHDLVDLKR